MNIILVLTYRVKYEKRTEFQALVEKFVKFKKENPEAFGGLKSWRLYQQEYGGVAGSYVEMWEYKSIEEMEEDSERMMKHREMMEIHKEFMQQIDHATFTESVWSVAA
ncbi:MAG: hypothetical protein ABSB40_12580 [Nitrososphaeria archaeon]|jgi:hypothetical protein